MRSSAVPLHLAAASFALWRGDLADARRATERGWELVRETEDWILAARTAAYAVRGRGRDRRRGAGTAATSPGWPERGSERGTSSARRRRS